MGLRCAGLGRRAARRGEGCSADAGRWGTQGARRDAARRVVLRGRGAGRGAGRRCLVDPFLSLPPIAVANPHSCR